MVTIREYKTNDWEKIQDSVEPFTPAYGDGDFDAIASRGIAVTALDGDNVMAVGGVTYIDEKEGMVWVKVSQQCAKRPVLWARTIKEVFGLMIDSVTGVEIYTYILKGFCKGEKLAKLIDMVNTDQSVEHNGKIYDRYMVAF